MKQDIIYTSDPIELLDTLRDFSFLDGYNLAIYQGEELVAYRGEKERMCGAFGETWLCHNDCQASFRLQTEEALASQTPRIFRCPTGLLNFIIPFRGRNGMDHYLLGGGVREKFMDLQHLEKIICQRKINGIYFLEQWESLPCASRAEVETIVNNIYGVLPLLNKDNYFARIYEQTVNLINTITDLGPEIDQARSVDEVIQLLSETLTILFDIPRVAILFPQGSNRQLILKGLLGISHPPVRLGDKSTSKLLQLQEQRKIILRGKAIQELFPYLESDHLTCQPMTVDGRLIGFLALLDTELSERDMMLIELLSGKVAAKLVRLRRRRNRVEETSRSNRILSMISQLAQIDNSQMFYQTLLEMAAELLGATKGSLMLLDDSGNKLSVLASLGMNRQLAINMHILKGQGIAGKVIESGAPMLVHNLNQDRRVSVTSRPRFATQSFLSIPFCSGESNIGVINLSDKQDGTAFTDADLQALLKFAAHGGTLVERTSMLERANLLEELSTSDALTGLYNRRFLNHRLEEEFSRSSRQNLKFSVMMLDLDHFKDYNDLCGHLAGDKALKKVAHLLRRSARDMDIVSRFGGEEFCIIVPESDAESARLVAERIRNAVERESFTREDELPLGRLSISIGIASFPGHGKDADTLLNAADLAMYQAKSNGRNRVVLFEPTLRKDKIVYI
jgi:diguanylate cyclase (GGDEF)-like protein